MDFHKMNWFIVLIFIIQGAYACRPQWRLQARAVLQEIFNLEPERMVNLHESDGRQQQSMSLENVLVNQRPPDDDPIHPFFEPFLFYTDHGGCYEDGDAQSYTGEISNTESGLPCAKWSRFTHLLHQRLLAAQERKKVKITENLWNLRPVDSGKEEAEIFGLNFTIREMRDRGLLDHNFCRDPDRSGKPWCYVETKSFMIWQACSIPKCTPCWRMRQKTKRYLLVPPLLDEMWIPECTLEGLFGHLQCWKSYCWCSEKSGRLIPGTLTRKSDGEPICESEGNHNKGQPKLRKKKRRLSANKPVRGKATFNSSAATEKPAVKPKAHTSHENEPRKTNEKTVNMDEWMWRVFHGIRRPKRVVESQNTRAEQTAKFGPKNRNSDESHKEPGDYQSSTSTENITIVTEGQQPRTYKCQVRYVTINSLRCVTPTTNESGKSHRCFIDERLRVIGWNCTRDLDDGACYVMKFARTPATVTSDGELLSTFQGYSYVCLSTLGKVVPNTDVCRRSDTILTTISMKLFGGEKYICVKSWKNWRLVKANCVKLTQQRKSEV